MLQVDHLQVSPSLLLLIAVGSVEVSLGSKGNWMEAKLVAKASGHLNWIDCGEVGVVWLGLLGWDWDGIKFDGHY